MNPAGSHQGQGALGNTDAPNAVQSHKAALRARSVMRGPHLITVLNGRDPALLIRPLQFIPVTGPALLTEQTVATTVSAVAAPRPIQRESVNAGAGVPARYLPAMGGNATTQINQHAPLDTGAA